MAQQQANRYDAIVIGGGHNGLVAAAYLAKHGARTVVLEKRHKTGGAADTSEPWPDELPGVKVNTLSYTMSLMPPSLRRDLQLERFGFKLLPLGQGYLPMPGGGSIVQSDDDAKTYESIARLSKHDADAYGPFYEWIGRIADIMGPLLMQTPPNAGFEEAQGHQGRRSARVGAAQAGGPADGGRHHAPVHDERHRPARPMVREPADDQGFMAVNGIIGTWAGPDAPGTAYVMMHHSVGDIGDGEVAAWGFMEGGMGAVAKALRGLGRVLRRRDPRERAGRHDPDDRRTRARRDPRERRGAAAPTVVTAATRKITFLQQLDANDLPDAFVHDIEHWKTRSGTVKVNLAIDRLPTFTADPGFDPEIHGGAIVLLDDRRPARERVPGRAVAGRPRARPFADTEIPTVFDTTLTPEG